ncbi:ATP-binding protein [uncultured Algibacter sp.]|uniref:ATP-binding protein n=1 Tax=uncultured Algibacter sp. TaxID=298659 RepID=UPI00321783BA
MKSCSLVCFIILCFIHVGIQAQSKEHNYKLWAEQMDTLTNVNSRLKLCKQMLFKVNDIHKAEIYAHLGGIFRTKRLVDSSLYYYNKSIKLSLSKGDATEEYLSLAYVHMSDLLIEINKKEEAIEVLQKAYPILIKNPKDKSWAQYYISYAFLAEKKGEITESVKFTDSAIAVYLKAKDSTGLVACYHNRGFYHYNLANYEDAVLDLLNAIQVNKKLNNLSALAGNYYILSGCYVALSEYKLSKKYAIEGIAISKKIENDFLTTLNYSILSESYKELKETDNALAASDSMLIVAYKLKDNGQIAQGLTDKAGIYLSNLKNYEEAEKNFIEAYKIVKTNNIEVYINPIVGGLAEVYLSMENYPKAFKYLKLQEENLIKLNIFSKMKELHEGYSKYYEKTGQLNMALTHLKKYHAIKDSISSEKVKTEVANLEKQYDTKSKELQIVKLDKEKTEQKQLTAEAKTKQNYYLFASILLLSLLILGFWLFKKLKKQKEELDATNKVKNRLFSIIAHDLRGMIIPFQRSGKILEHYIENKNYDKTIVFSQELQKNSEGLSNMLDNLLNWSLEQMNGYKINPELLNVNNELESIKTNFSQQAEFKNTKINIINDEEIAMNMDKGAFHIIFRNLIGNALKYTDNGTIRLGINREINTLKCSIIDTGVGMDKEQLKDIFSLETKTSSTGTKGEKGAGLGLSLVYRFIKMNGGTIEVSSEQRVGTKFDLSFPLSEFDIAETKKVNAKELSA